MRRSTEEGRKIMGFYVYKFISRESEVLYVGRTTDIEVRVRDHSIEKEFYNEVFKIKYAEFDRATDKRITHGKTEKQKSKKKKQTADKGIENARRLKDKVQMKESQI